MAKKIKNESRIATTSALDSSTEAVAKKKRSKAPASPRPAAKNKSAAGAPKKSAASRGPKPGKPPGPSDAEVRLRAYLLAERRVHLALPGDPAKDWLEARKQLLAEAGRGG